MRFARFLADGGVLYGVIEGELIYEIDRYPVEGVEGIERRRSFNIEDVRFLAPVIPSKIVAIGLNFKAHAAEFNKPLPEEPMIFLKPGTSVIGPLDKIVYPSHMSRRVDYEGELALVIGKKAKDVSVEGAKEYIFGYTCINDVTARDLQGKDVQYTRAKGFDTFAPIGPWIETELDPTGVRIQTFINGEKRQDASTSDMVFNVYELLSFVSRVMTLLPGDVIATGTPSGVGKVKPGDRIEVRIEGIGSLVNTVIGREAE